MNRLSGICDPPDPYREVREGLGKNGRQPLMNTGDGMADRIQDMVSSINCRLQKFGGAAVYYQGRNADGSYRVVDPCATPQWSALGDTTTAPGLVDSAKAELPTFLFGAAVGGVVGGLIAWALCKNMASELIRSK